MTRPTERLTRLLKASGGWGKTIKEYSYVATLTRIDSDEVLALRMEYFQNKQDVGKVLREEYPDWNVKNISKLYDDDFRRGGDRY